MSKELLVNKGQKTAVFLPPSITESFEIVLGRAHELVKGEKEIVLVYCSGAIRGCVANPFKFKRLCRHCTKVTKTAIDDLFENTDTEELANRVAPTRIPLELKESSKRGVRSTILRFIARI